MSTISATISVACLILALANLYILSVMWRVDATIKPWRAAAVAAYVVSLLVMYDQDPAMKNPDTLHTGIYVFLAAVAACNVVLLIRRAKNK